MFDRTKMNIALQLAHLFVLNNGHIDSYKGLL
jgi:hypothetical protein